MIILDTSGLLAALFVDQNQHDACAQVLRNAEPPLLLSPFVLAETDYLIQKYSGVAMERLFLSDVVRGAYELVPFNHADMKLAAETVGLYNDLEIGIADASIVAIGARYQCRDVLTLDIRHFRALRPQGVKKRGFRLLPADA